MGKRVRSDGDGLHQRCDTEDIDHALHIVGEHLQAHLGFDLFEGPHQEMGAAHPGLESPERMLDGLPADGRSLRHSVEPGLHLRSEEHTSELQSLMRISYAVFCLKKKK